MWPFILTFWKLWVHFPSFLKIIIYCPMAFHWLLKKLFITLVKNRRGSFRDDIFCSSLWLDPQIKTLIQHFCKLQVLYMLNGNHSNNQSIIHTPGISSNIGENLCIPKQRISKYLFVRRAGNDDIFFKQFSKTYIQYLNNNTDALAVDHGP